MEKAAGRKNFPQLAVACAILSVLGLMTSVRGQCTSCLVRNRYNQLVLDVPNFSTVSGQELIMWVSNGGTNQKWSFQTAAGGGAYMTITNLNSGLVLDVGDTGPNGYTVVVQSAATGYDSQKWRVVPSATFSGYFNIINKATGLALDSSNCRSAVSGSPAGVYPFDPFNDCHAWALPGYSVPSPSASRSPGIVTPQVSRLPSPVAQTDRPPSPPPGATSPSPPSPGSPSPSASPFPSSSSPSASATPSSSPSALPSMSSSALPSLSPSPSASASLPTPTTEAK